MNRLTKWCCLCLLLITLMACNNNTNSKTKGAEDVLEHVLPTGEIHAYYFHATRRCATCEAVETVTTNFLQQHYANNVIFTSVNRDDSNNASLIKAYDVKGQTLLIVKDDKRINITNEAFLNARTNPDKLEAKLKLTIESLL